MSHLLRPWQGRSGAWYPHSIHFPGERIPAGPANYILVQRFADGQRIPLYIGRTGDMRDRLRAHRRRHPRMCEEANELHLHLLAGDAAERQRIAADLNERHPTLYNEPSAVRSAGLEALLPAAWRVRMLAA